MRVAPFNAAVRLISKATVMTRAKVCSRDPKRGARSLPFSRPAEPAHSVAAE